MKQIRDSGLESVGKQHLALVAAAERRKYVDNNILSQHNCN
jgi:hypothetical protein